MPELSGMSNNKRNILNSLGVDVVNPPKNPFPSYAFSAGGFKSSSYNFNSEAMERNARIFNQIKNRAFSNNTPDIMRSAHSTFYKNAPQQQIRNFRNFIDEGPGNRLVTFDIETLGDLKRRNTDFFSPTEFFFSERKVTESAHSLSLSSPVRRKGFLVRPDEDTVKGLRNIIKRAEQGGSLNRSESMSLGSLIKYSGDIGTTDSGLVEHNIDALRSYTTETSGGRHLIDTTNPESIKYARQGLENLVKRGKAPSEVAGEIGNYLDNPALQNAFFAGHNISAFDINAMEDFLGSHGVNTDVVPDSSRQFDTYGLTKTIFPEPMSLSRLPDVSTQDIIDVSKKSGGGFTLDSLSQLLLDENELQQFQAHRAESDVIANEIITEKLFFENDAFNYITEDVMRGPGDGIASTPAYSFDMGNVSQNEMFFSTRGYREGQKGLSFVAQETQEGMELASDRWVIPSQKPLSFQRAYKTKGGLFGIELLDPQSGKHHYINRETREEVENIFNRFLSPASDFSDDQIRRYSQYARDDAARSTLRKLLKSPSTRGFQHLDRFTQAAEEEKQFIGNLSRRLEDVRGIGTKKRSRIIDYITSNSSIEQVEDLTQVKGVGSKTVENLRGSGVVDEVNEFYNERIPEIFSYEGDEGRVYLESFANKYKRINERMMSEHAFVRPLMNRIEERIPMTEGADKYEVLRQRHRALVEAYSKYEEDFGSYRRITEVPEYRQNFYRIPHPQGGQQHIPLDEFDRTRGRLMSAFGDISPARATSGSDTKTYASSVLETIEGHVRSFDEGLTHLQEAHRLAYEEGKPQQAAQETINFLRNTKDYLPSYMEPEQRIKELYNNPNVARQQIDVLSKQLGVQTKSGVRGGIENRDEILGELRNVREYVRNQDSAFYMSGAMARFMHQYKDDIPGFRSPFQEVENLRGVPQERINKALENVDEYAELGIKRAKTTREVSLKGTKIEDAFQLKKKLNILDDNLQRRYQELGIENTPRRMSAAADDLLQQFSTMMGDVNKEGYPEGRLGMNVFFEGTVESNPRMTMALYDSNRFENLSRKQLDELRKMNDVATIEVPLISKNQYINYGNQKLIAPSAILRRNTDDMSKAIASGDEIKVNSAFDIVSEKLKRKVGRITGAVKQGDTREAERIANQAIRGGLDDLTGANNPFIDMDMTASNDPADIFKKKYLMFSGLFEDKQGNWYNPFDLDSQGRAKKMYAQDKIKLFKEDGYRRQFERLLQENVGKDISINLSGTRGKNIGKGVMSLSDVRDYTTLGYYNNPGRERMLQAFGTRKLTSESRSALESLEGITFNPLMISDTAAETFNMGETLQDARGNMPGFQSRVAFVSEDEMVGRISQAIESGAGTKADRELLQSLETFPSTFEDMALGSREVMDAYRSTLEKPFRVEGYKEPQLLDHIKRQIDEKGRYKLDYMEDMVETSGETIKSEYRAQHYITDYKKEGDDLILKLQEEYQARQGFTSVMIGQEKQTIGTQFSQDVFEEAFGEGVHFVSSAGQKGHGAYGDVMSGVIKDAVRQINELDVKREQKRIRFEELGRITKEMMGIEVDRTDLRSEDSILSALKYPDRAGKDIIDFSQDDLLSRINQIEGVNVDPNILTMETRFLKNEENMHYMSLFGNRGKKGMRATPDLVERLEDMNFNEFAKYLDTRITEGIKPKQQQLIVDETRALKHLAEASKINEPNFVPEGQNVKSFSEAIEEFDRVPSGTFVGKGKKTTYQQGKYLLEDLEGTILDPKREGTFVELPEAVNVRVRNQAGRERYQSIKNIYMGVSDLNPNEEVGRGKLYTAGPLGKRQRNIMETMQDYHMATTQSDEWQEIARKKYGTTDLNESINRIRNKMQREVQEYYDRANLDVTASRRAGGRAAKNVTSTEVPGSGYFLLQGRSPLEHTDMPESAYAEDLAKARQRFNDDLAANDVLISTEDARRLAGIDESGEFVSESARKQFEQMREGSGAFGISVRYPTSFPGSATPVKIKAAEGVESGVAEQSSLLTTQMQKGDYDTDKVALHMLPASGTKEAERLGLDTEKLEEEYNRVQRELEEGNFTGDRSYFEKFKSKVQEEIDQPRGYNIVGDEVKKQLEGAEGVSRNFADNLVEAKMRNASYTGMITNVADKARRIGINNLGEEGFKEHGRPFLESIGRIIEEPISAKHLMEEGSSSKDISPQKVYDSLRKGDLGNLETLLHQGDSPVLTDTQWKAFEAALGNADSSQYQDLAQDIHTSTRMLNKGIEPTMEALEQNTEPASRKREFMDKHVFGKVSDDLVNEGMSASNQTQRFMQEQANRAQNFKQVQEALGDVTVEAASKAGPAGLGVGKLAGAFIGGMAISEFGSTQDPLPMDYLDQPAMQPTPDTGKRESYAHIQDMSGFKQALSAYSEGRNIEGATDIPDVVKQENINMVVQGKTTIDKDPKQLASVVNEEFKNELQFPININVKTQDDRKGLSPQWAEQQVLDLID